MMYQEKIADGSTGGDTPAAVNDVLGQIRTILALIAGFVCLAKLIQIGMQYMLTGSGGKGQAKSSVVPWLAGTLVCAGYAIFGEKIINLIKENAGSGGVLHPDDPSKVVQSLGSLVLGWFSGTAIAIAIGMLMYIGIKYMTSSAVERAQAKNTLIPWVIGCLIAGGAGKIMQLVIDIATNAGGGGGLTTGDDVVAMVTNLFSRLL